MTKKTIYIYIFIITFILNGCGFWTIAVDNIGEAIFESPAEIKNKIKDPIKENVKIAALWSGHSTVLIQLYDKLIITDPFQTNQLAGFFERKIEAGLDLDYLSRLDLTLVSHAHMDHFSLASVDMIADKFPGTHLVFPAGVEYYMPNYDLKLRRVESTLPNSNKYVNDPIVVNDITITPVYAVHSGGRYMLDTYTWKRRGATGYIIQYKDASIYFAGDTGYDEVAFKEMGKKFNIDVAFIPIGPCRACEAAGFWHHTTSAEALIVFREIGAKYMVPIHYGSLKYMRDPDTPLYALQEMLNNTAAGFIDIKEKVIIMDEGDQKIFE